MASWKTTALLRLDGEVTLCEPSIFIDLGQSAVSKNGGVRNRACRDGALIYAGRSDARWPGFDREGIVLRGHASLAILRTI
jgi:hypothetical protein